LCTGYGGLELALELAGVKIDLIAVADNDPAASAVLAAHYPGVPNLGDVKAIDFAALPEIDLLTAGYPCQPFSLAGQRKGTDDERHLWPYVFAGIRVLRPRGVLLENVAGHRSRGLAEVIADLASIGYVGSWVSLRASDVGAAHQRDRVFIYAHPADANGDGLEPSIGPLSGPAHDAAGRHRAVGGIELLPTPRASPNENRSTKPTPSQAVGKHGRYLASEVCALLPSPRAKDGSKGDLALPAAVQPERWGKYAEAIERWERITGRAAPEPTEPGKSTAVRLAPVFVEWLMGLEPGYVTAVPGLSRNDQLRLLGNGVVPQQGAEAIYQISPTPKGQETMGNTLDMNKIRNDHQARTDRITEAVAKANPYQLDCSLTELIPGIVAGLTELAAIWREEAQRLSDLPSPKPKGWKGTMDSLRDCATRVMGVAVAMEKHGLSEAADAGPKEPASGSTSTPAPGADGSTLDTHQDAPPRPSDDPAGDFLCDMAPLLEPKKAGDWTGLDRQLSNELLMVGIKDGFVTPEVAAQVRAEKERREGEAIYMNSGGILDTTQPAMLTVTWDDNGAGVSRQVTTVLPEGLDVQIIPGFDPGQFTIGAAAPPPAWTNLPEVPVFGLDDDLATWLPVPDHVSVSQANLYGECQLKGWLKYRRGAFDRPSWSLVGGKAFHECVRILEGAFADMSEHGMFFEVNKIWNAAFIAAIEETQRENPLYPQDTWHASNKGKEDQKWWNLDGPEMVHRYLQWAANFRAQGWELLKTQDGRRVVELEFLAWLGGGSVKGFIDSAWYHAGKNMILIVDWKSGTSKPADYFQQATYRHALEPRVDIGGAVWAGAFWDARTGQLGIMVDLDVRHPRAEVEMRLSGPRRIDAAGLYMPNVNTGYGGCNSCSLKRSCPVGSRIGKGEIT
jgi:DNA (cytosine-5)-methyltransferase 1